MRILNREITITTALIGNIVIVAFVIGAICTWLVTSMGAQEIKNKEADRLAGIAWTISGQISRAMVERYADVRAARDIFENELRNSPPLAKRAVLDRVRTNNQDFSWLGIVSANGEIEIGTDGLLEGMSITGRNWFEGARQAPVFFGNVHPAKLLEAHIKNPDGSPLYLLDIALPLRSPSGQVIGVVGSHMNWRMIDELIKQSLNRQTDTAPLAVAVVDSDGAILIDTNGAAGNVAEILKDLKPGKMIRSGWPGASTTSFLVSEPTPKADPLSGPDWRVVVRTPVAAIEDGITKLRWLIVTSGVIAGLIFVILGLYAVRLVTRPLEQLTEDINRFGERGLLPDAAPSGHIVEVRLLHTAFQKMAEKVTTQNEMLRETQTEIVHALARAGEFRDNDTGSHVLRMSHCCARLAELAGCDKEEVEQIRLAAQMHDIGKIGIPDAILLKEGRLNEDERAIIEDHSEIGASIMSGLDTPLLNLARTIALTHHEKWNGAGYPNHLAGESIPLAGRIAAICDVFDATLSSRSYKQGWATEKVVAYMKEQAGQHFDPKLVDLLLTHLDDFLAIRAGLSDIPDNSQS